MICKPRVFSVNTHNSFIVLTQPECLKLILFYASQRIDFIFR